MKTILFLLTFSICVFSQNQPRNQNIMAGEYFVNTDPGEGNGTSLSSTFGFTTATVTFSSTINMNDVVYIRFKSSSGRWGSPRSFKNLYPIPSTGSIIASGEYFLNTDPGINDASGFNFQNGNEVNVSSVKANRNDRIFLRVKDSYGRWSDAACKSYQYKSLIGAQYKIKYKNGNTTAWQNMSVQDQQYPSAYYTALSNPIVSIGNGDTVFVRFQSDDYIWGIISNNYSVPSTNVGNKISNTPTKFSLGNAYPNPFNPSTKIGYDISKTTHVRLSIYDILGREVAILVDKEVSPGRYEVTFDARDLSSGVYFYRLETSLFAETKKLVLMR